MFFLFHGVVISDFCSAFRLVVKQITSAIFTPWRKIVFIVINNAVFALVNHFLVAFHIGSSACVFHIFGEVCPFIMLKQTFFIPIRNMFERRPDIYPFYVRIGLSVSSAITSTTEKYHSSIYSFQAVLIFLSSNICILSLLFITKPPITSYVYFNTNFYKLQYFRE